MRSLFDSSTFPSSLHVASTSRVRQSSATDTTLTLDKVFGDALIQYTEKTKANNIKNTQFRGDTANLHPSSFQIESHYELSELKTGVTDEYQLKSSCFQHSFDLRYGGWRRRSPNVFSVSNENLWDEAMKFTYESFPWKCFSFIARKSIFSSPANGYWCFSSIISRRNKRPRVPYTCPTSCWSISAHR